MKSDLATLTIFFSKKYSNFLRKRTRLLEKLEVFVNHQIKKLKFNIGGKFGITQACAEYLSCQPFNCICLLTFVLSWVNLASADTGSLNTPLIQLAINPQSQPAIQFEAKQAKLENILKAFTSKTGAVIHYSVLPEEPVTATCAGDSVKQVMECLLGNKVDRVYRKVNNARQASRLTKSAIAKEEIWILGTRYGNSGNMSCTLDSSKSSKPEVAVNETDALPQQALIKMAQIISDPRYADIGKQALSMLAAQGKTGDAKTDAEIVDTLEKALQDKNPEARAQAVFGLSQQDSNNTEVLHEALQDKNSDVRLMAVDSAKADTPQGQAILNEALSDSDETVRALAEQKLNAAGQ